MSTPSSGSGIDLFNVFSLLGTAGDHHSTGSLSRAGYTGFRPSHGPIIHLLLDGPHTVGEMAPRLQVTQQAVSKTVRELASHGFVEQLLDNEDRRRRPVALTDRGREAVALADEARAELLEKLAATVGHDQVASATEVLHAMVEHLGLGEQLHDRSVPPPRQPAL